MILYLLPSEFLGVGELRSDVAYWPRLLACPGWLAHTDSIRHSFFARCLKVPSWIEHSNSSLGRRFSPYIQLNTVW